MARRAALISGITGQDGSYLAELLVSKGYEVHGITRNPDAKSCFAQFDDFRAPSEITFHVGDISVSSDISSIIAAVNPDEFYHLAGHTFIGTIPDEFNAFRANAGGTHEVLSALKATSPHCRAFVAGSSEMFGDVDVSPQNEDTPFRPRTVYGISKVAAYYLMRHYRRIHGLFACCGILYNHESPRRGQQFVTRKITRSAALIKRGELNELRLGDLNARRDWGHARDYVQAMWLMLQQPDPDDYIIATGRTHSVQDLVSEAFGYLGLRWQDYVVIDAEFQRKPELFLLAGDPAKAEKELGWRAQCDLKSLIREMVDHDLRRS